MRQKANDKQLTFAFDPPAAGSLINAVCHNSDDDGCLCLAPATHFDTDSGLPLCDLHNHPAHMAPRLPGEKSAARRPAVPKRVGY